MSTKNRCYKCNVEIYFTSREAVTPTGKSTKDPLTGKAIPLNPFTHEQHTCRPEDISAYRETDEYKKTITEWKNRQQQKEKENFGSTNSNGSSPSYNTTNKNNNNNNNSTNQDLEKILNSISHTNTIIEQIQTDYKADMTAINKGIIAIKNALNVGTDRSSSSGSNQKEVGG